MESWQGHDLQKFQARWSKRDHSVSATLARLNGLVKHLRSAAVRRGKSSQEVYKAPPAPGPNAFEPGARGHAGPMAEMPTDAADVRRLLFSCFFVMYFEAPRKTGTCSPRKHPPLAAGCTPCAGFYENHVRDVEKSFHGY